MLLVTARLQPRKVRRRQVEQTVADKPHYTVRFGGQASVIAAALQTQWQAPSGAIVRRAAQFESVGC